MVVAGLAGGGEPAFPGAALAGMVFRGATLAAAGGAALMAASAAAGGAALAALAAAGGAALAALAAAGGAALAAAPCSTGGVPEVAAAAAGGDNDGESHWRSMEPEERTPQVEGVDG